MLATLVIGLREGLEAALIVGIIAAFLRKNGKSLAPMWFGVVLAVLLSIGVGVALRAVERSLPQAKQEAMESVIGAVAIVFVTGMIVWMNTHARGMKRELEAEAAAALGQGGARSLAIMAFLAVLKEGFETSVFLLATFSAAQSARFAAAGAVIGVVVAAGIGWGIYAGGVRLNLSRFFRATGAFLVLVAAGLAVTMLRTAHEAGWINAGQQKTVNLSWLVRPGTVLSALITGVLGIPADPRSIELLGWFAYLVPVGIYVYWPARRRPTGKAVAWTQLGAAAGLAAVGVVLAVAYPAPHGPAPRSVSLVSASGVSQNLIGVATLNQVMGEPTALTVSLTGEPVATVPLGADLAVPDEHAGVAATAWTTQRTEASAGGTQTVTLDQLVKLAGGRIPIGISPQQNPGPFTVQETTVATDTVWVARGMLLDASEHTKTIAKISGSGLVTARTITLPADQSAGWTVATADSQGVAAELSRYASRTTERRLWANQLPILLGLAALLFAAAGARTLGRFHGTAVRSPAAGFSVVSETPARRQATDQQARSDSYAAQ